MEEFEIGIGTGLLVAALSAGSETSRAIAYEMVTMAVSLSFISDSTSIVMASTEYKVLN